MSDQLLSIPQVAETERKLAESLERLGVCEEAIDWCQGQTLAEAWHTCDRADWMLWLCATMIDTPGWPTHKALVAAICAVVRPALQYVPAGEDRPMLAIKTTEAWTRGEATQEAVSAAAYGADTAAYAADPDSAADVAEAAGYAAARAAANAAAHAAGYAAGDADADASYAAGYAANAATDAAACVANAAGYAAYAALHAAALRDGAEIVRSMLSPPVDGADHE